MDKIAQYKIFNKKLNLLNSFKLFVKTCFKTFFKFSKIVKYIHFQLKPF